MLTGFRKVEIYISFMLEESGTLLQKVLRDPGTFQSSKDVAHCSYVPRWQMELQLSHSRSMDNGKVAKIGALLYFF